MLRCLALMRQKPSGHKELGISASVLQAHAKAETAIQRLLSELLDGACRSYRLKEFDISGLEILARRMTWAQAFESRHWSCLLREVTSRLNSNSIEHMAIGVE